MELFSLRKLVILYTLYLVMLIHSSVFDSKFHAYPFFSFWLKISAVVVQSLSHVQLFATPWIIAHQASLPFTISQSCSNSCLLSQWCHPTVWSSVSLFSSCLQSFPTSFLRNWFFLSSGQSIEASAWTSVLPINIQCWFPLGLTGLITLLFKGLCLL